MGYVDELYLTRKWYVSHEILTLAPDHSPADAKLDVWENLILIRAQSPEEAYLKAMEHGRANESAITVGGEKGSVRFRGLRDLVLIYDELEDGAEIEWHEMDLTREEVDELLKDKNDLHAFNPVTK